MAAKVAFRGGWTCDCVKTSLPWVEEDMRQRGIINNSIDIFQLGWRGDVSASAGTHDEGGCTDVGQWSVAAIDVWRIWGWTMQRRDLSGIQTHGHGWPYGCPHLAPAAQYQAREWDQGDNGLVNQGPIAGRYPVKNWKTALEEGVQRMYTLEDIEAAARRGALAARNDIAEAVWRKDGLINNKGFAPGSAGNYVNGNEALIGIMHRADTLPSPADIAAAVDAKLDAEHAATKAQIDALSKKIDALANTLAVRPAAAAAEGATEDQDPSHAYLKEDQP